MIDRSEILEVATDLSLAPEVVEKDYVLAWLLAGIYRNEELAGAWTFKGGTCLKKCYFETYRFSEDLDFTVAAEAQMDGGFLTAAFTGSPKLCTTRSALRFRWTGSVLTSTATSAMG